MNDDITVELTEVPSPLGPLRILAQAGTITGVYLPDHRASPDCRAVERPEDPLLRRAARQLEEYFAGERTRFDLPLRLRGTAFQQAIWAELRQIPFGATTTYGQLAAAVGRPNASRAVGAANGRNPISIIVPCHRVIGANGALTGYAGGVEAKRWLLRLEAQATPNSEPEIRSETTLVSH